MMVDQERADLIAAQHSARLLQFEGKSVPLDPDLEKKALTRAVRLPSRPDPLPIPNAPSVARSRAESIPDVAKIAARAASRFDAIAARYRMIAIGSAVVLILALALAVFGGGGEPRKIRLRVSSIPAAAAVFVDGEAVGVTPLDHEVEVEDETVHIEFVLDGYRGHQVTIGTEAAELRYEARLEKEE
jgi:hypothetical protein